jgi:uncharacterized membrane protein
MCCFFNGYRVFGIFNGFGGILGLVLTILGILIAVKLIKDMFFCGVSNKK